MSQRDARLAQLQRDIAEVSVEEAHRRQRAGALLIDVRESDEIAGGSPPGALRLGRGHLELRIETTEPDLDRELLLLCAGGRRSLFAADDLLRLGFRDVSSVAGGFTSWKNAGLPIEVPDVLSSGQRERYGRHLLIPEIGEQGQAALLRSKVLVIGAGGLGSPAAYYLAAAGVGTLGIVDDDIVDRSNLQRQILHSDDVVGRPKVDSARATLARFNPEIDIRAHHLRLTSQNVDTVFADYDVVVDGSDNFPTRYLVNDACVKLGIPNVHGSIFRFEGQVSVFWPTYGKRRGPCYRCLFAAPPPPELAPSCAEAGVLGVLPGVVGTLEAVEAIKLLLDLGDPLVGRWLIYDALRATFVEIQQRPDPNCRYCAEGVAFPGYIDYEQFCSSR